MKVSEKNYTISKLAINTDEHLNIAYEHKDAPAPLYLNHYDIYININAGKIIVRV